jgi:hypothetical protein
MKTMEEIYDGSFGKLMKISDKIFIGNNNKYSVDLPLYTVLQDMCVKSIKLINFPKGSYNLHLDYCDSFNMPFHNDVVEFNSITNPTFERFQSFTNKENKPIAERKLIDYLDFSNVPVICIKSHDLYNSITHKFNQDVYKFEITTLDGTTHVESLYPNRLMRLNLAFPVDRIECEKKGVTLLLNHTKVKSDNRVWDFKQIKQKNSDIANLDKLANEKSRIEMYKKDSEYYTPTLLDDTVNMSMYRNVHLMFDKDIDGEVLIKWSHFNILLKHEDSSVITWRYSS